MEAGGSLRTGTGSSSSVHPAGLALTVRNAGRQAVPPGGLCWGRSPSALLRCLVAESSGTFSGSSVEGAGTAGSRPSCGLTQSWSSPCGGGVGRRASPWRASELPGAGVLARAGAGATARGRASLGRSSSREGSARPAERATRERGHLGAWSPGQPRSRPGRARVLELLLSPAEGARLSSGRARHSQTPGPWVRRAGRHSGEGEPRSWAEPRALSGRPPLRSWGLRGGGPQGSVNPARRRVRVARASGAVAPARPVTPSRRGAGCRRRLRLGGRPRSALERVLAQTLLA